jgi:hypothetical protein
MFAGYAIETTSTGERIIDRVSSRDVRSHKISIGGGLNFFPNALQAGGILTESKSEYVKPDCFWEKALFTLLELLP